MNAPTPDPAHLLIVDDSEPSRRATRGLFELHGYKVSDCASGEEALELLAKDSTISVCILDQKLSVGPPSGEARMDGMETLRAMVQKHPQIPVIMFTAIEDRGQEAIRGGATFYYYKPRLDPAHLATLVDALVKMQVLQRNYNQLQAIIDAMGVEVMVRDREYRVICMNKLKADKWRKRWDRLSSFRLWPGQSKCYDCFEPETSGNCRNDCPADEVFKNGDIVQKEHKAKDDELLIIAGPIRRADGSFDQVVEVCVDIKRRKRATEAAVRIHEAASKPLAELGKVIVENVHRIFGQRVRLYFLNPHSGRLEGLACAKMHRLPFRKHQLEATDVQAERAFQEAKPVVFHEEELRHDPCMQVLRNEGVTQKIIVPLFYCNERVGMLVVDNKLSEKPFDPEDTDILALLTASISASLRHSSETERAHKRIQHLAAINRIDDELVRAGQAQAIFTAISKELRSVLGAQSAWLLFRESGVVQLRTASFAGNLKNEWLATGHPGNVGLVARCLKAGERQVEQDARQNEDFKAYIKRVENPDFRGYLEKVSAVIAVPVLQDKTALGVCVLFFRVPPKLTEDEKQFLNDVAKRVTIALARIEDQRRVEAIAIEQAKLSDLGLLGAGVAHSLKNPLAEAIAALACFRDESIPSGKGQAKLQEAEQAITKAANLVRNLSAWARPQGGDPVELDLMQTFEELRAITKQGAGEESVSFEVNISPNAQFVWGPPDALKMAFVDLLANAVKAMPRGGSLVVTARKEAGSQFVQLDIEDTGPGLPENVEKAIFGDGETFVTVPVGGIGLGLYLAKKVVTAAGGTLQYARKKTGGSRFSALLPQMK